MILMGLAIMCGLGTSYMTSRLLADRTPAQEEKNQILVATKVLSVGERITRPEVMFELKQVSKENEPPDAIKDIEKLRGKMMRQGLNKGAHITQGNLYDKDGLDIPEGHQAVGLPVNLRTTVAGFASLPGSRVDLILTVRAQDINAASARVLLQNVLVLAADARTVREGEIISAASVVTFALKEDDRLKVTLAQDLGTLSLSLRKLNDDRVVEQTVVIGSEILTNKKKIEPKEVVEVKPPEPIKPPVTEGEAPKFTVGHYDIVNGSESGAREVTRVHYKQFADGSIVIERREQIESTRIGAVQQVSPPPSATNPKKGGKPEDY